MNFSDKVKNMVVESAIKKETVFSDEYVSKEQIKNRINFLRSMPVENDTEDKIRNVLCDTTEAIVDSVPVITITIDQ